MEKREYRFVCEIIDCETDEVVIASRTFLSEIGPFGECESVDMEVGSMLRSFNKTARDVHEKEHLGLSEEE